MNERPAFAVTRAPAKHPGPTPPEGAPAPPRQVRQQRKTAEASNAAALRASDGRTTDADASPSGVPAERTFQQDMTSENPEAVAYELFDDMMGRILACKNPQLVLTILKVVREMDNEDWAIAKTMLVKLYG